MLSRVLPLVGATVIVVAGLTAPASAGVPLKSVEPQITTPDVSAATHHDLSRPLTELAGKPQASRLDPDDPRLVIPNKPLPGDRIDDIMAGNPGPPVIPDPTAPPPESADMPTADSFEGISNRNFVYPPDPDGDVGPNHYVQMVNMSIQVFDKAGASLYGPEDSNVIWSGFAGDCADTNDGDPIVLYDQFADRWIVSQFSVGGVGLHECVAVSASPDPTGAWYRYQFSYDDFPDYPKLGVWPDGYYVTYNMFDETSMSFRNTKVCALDRAKMLAGLAATQQCFDLAVEWSLLPSDADGTTPPPAGSPNYMVGEHWSDQDRLTMYKFAVDWSDPAGTTLTGPIEIPVNAFTWACLGVVRGRCVPQNTDVTTQKLESLGGRMMYRLAYRNFGTHESLVTNHTVAMDGELGQTAQLGIGWYELRAPDAANPTVYQQGTTADPDGTTFRWMGSMAQDKQGNMALGYSASSSTTLPSIRYNGRLVSDPLNQLPQAEGIIFSGTGAQTGSAGRWGDYSSMHTDPLDDCTFWYTNEYVQTTGSAPWRTRIGYFKYPDCTGTATVPSAPTLEAERGDQSVTVNITAPDNGGNPINEYVVTASPGGATCTTRPGVDPDPLRCSFTGLANGTTYTFSGTARNGVGESAAGTVTATPVTVPDAPTSVSGTAGYQRVTVSWTAPADDGGAEITEYEVTSSPDGETCTAEGTTSCTVTGLTNGTPYTFRVTAKNVVGFGPLSAPSSAVIPTPTAPDPPTSVSGLPGNQQVTVSWIAAANNGGSAITEYEVTASPDGQTCTSDAGSPVIPSCTVTGLSNGTDYTFTVKAKNSLGYGAPSAPSAAVVPRTVPGAPTSVTGVPGDRQVEVSWAVPASNGGAAITAYEVTSSPEGMTCTSNGATSCTVTGLTNGTAYTFTVMARNVAGFGPASVASDPVAPRTVPDAPTAVTGVPGNGRVQVSWSAPASDGAAAITEYRVTSSPEGRTCTSNSGSPVTTTCAVTGLTNGTAYTFTVRAKNVAGFGPESAPSDSLTPRTVPGAPTSVTGVPGDRQVEVSWAAPASSGGAAITAYEVTSSPEGMTCTSNGATSCTVTGLTNGTAYTFTVMARNVAGFGPESAASDPVTPRTVPAAPTSVMAVPENGKAQVSWSAPASDGGSAIEKYHVITSPGGATCESATTTCTVKGLTNGQAYTFKVRAKNAIGEGPHSAASAPVTPVGPPAAPSNVVVVPGDREAVVSWTAPTDTGGLPIVKYVVTANPGGFTCETATTTCTVKGLANGQAYTFSVVAVTAAGSGGAAAGPSETPQPDQQTAVVSVPKKIKYQGKTVLLTKAVVTNAGQKATAKVKVKPKSSKYAAVRITKRGKVVIRTFGKKKLTVTLTLSAPATSSFTSYSYTKKWTVKKK